MFCRLFKNSFSKTKNIHYNKKFTFSSSTALSLSTSQTHFTKPSNFSSSDPNTSKILERLYLYRNNPTLAHSYFTQLNQHKQHGFCYNIQTYVAIIKIMCYWNWIRKLDSLFIDIIAHSKQDPSFKINDLFDSLFDDVVDVNQNHYLLRAFNGFVKACVSRNMFDEAIDFLSRRSLILPNVLSFNFLINRLVIHDRIDTALFLFDQYKSFGLIFNRYTYAIVIKARCKKGNLEQAFCVFDEMKEVGVDPDSYCYATLIEGLCNNNRSDLGYGVLQDCRTRSVPLDVYAYTVVIRGFCNEMELDKAESVFSEMEKLGLVPDVYIYCALVHGYCKSRNLDKALSIHDSMLSRGIETNCVIVSCILHCLDEMGRASEVVATFEKIKESGLYLDGVAYNIVFYSLCKLGKLDEAVGMLEELKSMHINLDIIHYTTLINGYCLKEKLDAAYSIFKEMEEQGFKPDVVTYNVLAIGMSRNHRYCETIDLLSYMDSQAVKPNSTTHKIIIEGLCSLGKVEEAEAHFNGLKDKSVEIYSAMVNSYCKMNCLREAYDLFQDMKTRGIKPDVFAYKVILEGLLNGRQEMIALDLYNEMSLKGMTPGATLNRRIQKAIMMQFHQ
ncbi:pentatricopeptide repeat-containing protein At2g26790, mitochondrial-like isoform X1 [Trifolium pratense]|uniref:pentatricopeptide repeat-containing protein At2g26790, mitochondrial-like isoform X1 n=2 Tax=Trifolium pratense TaxID=57577 RepID=UPI001E694975|nr:pentatricopeptide repeat-containing protein At2g26790, mitochondrial-like isoform X1 [Trifolium pratense]XP_045807172.1 pentatricopeptide repeat-containing protein At2g26790, mitochondrial-like isoform X1 [Trifolium pratense]XP_045807174.1 pentatricopeptide repeat-containing protein At2g26790, mitochondrial-like isoform X1 [Trifolium pratense]XP_045807175.1 pentatricopeptide repeat-containing protein At2g26790, mitochondrial-like isoform X1 [Trifolium pratense]